MLDKILLQIAKHTILTHLKNANPINKKKLLHEYPFLAKEGASFVTLNERGMLRGCIGSIVAHRNLIDDIISNAHAAAFRDPRFAPLQIHELSELKIEVSVLTPAELIEYSDYEDLRQKIVPKKDGLILKHANYQGTFLPQVWESLKTTEEFLSELSYKAGANPTIYKEHPEVYRYRVEAIEEHFDAIAPLQQQSSLDMIREMSVVGSFYPQKAQDIVRYFEHFDAIDDNELSHIKPRALIVPHAGYIYSGYTAHVAYKLLRNSDIKNILIIGPSHRVAYDGSSIGRYQGYMTPFGMIESANDLAQDLKEKFQIPFVAQAHIEHSTEVQFPFIKYYFPDAKIVELIYSDTNAQELSNIINFALARKDCTVIISTDLSHFHTQIEAYKIDKICLDAIENLNIEKLQKGCEACGRMGVEAMLLSAHDMKLDVKLLDYRTSADASEDTSRVVGYVSACFMEKS